MFAVDSIPAVFAITRDEFIIYTSNMCAILGLRSLYFVLAHIIDRFIYLKIGLAIVLELCRYENADGRHLSRAEFGFHWRSSSAILTVTIVLSMRATRGQKPKKIAEAAAGPPPLEK